MTDNGGRSQPELAHVAHRRPADLDRPSRRSLTPPQRRFNTLIRQIEQARQTLAAWHDNIAV